MHMDASLNRSCKHKYFTKVQVKLPRLSARCRRTVSDYVATHTWCINIPENVKIKDRPAASFASFLIDLSHTSREAQPPECLGYRFFLSLNASVRPSVLSALIM